MSKMDRTIRPYRRHYHGLTKTRVHVIWCAMIQRCMNPDSSHWKSYGGRGITVCERWMSFPNFLADMGQPPPKMTLERKNNDRGYEPGNCIWATRKQQGRNRRTNRMIEFQGESHCLAEWAEILGMSQKTLQMRLSDYGWSIERTLTTPRGNYETKLEFRGEVYDLYEWAAIFGLSYKIIWDRLKRGWSIEKALTQPPRQLSPSRDPKIR